MDEIPVSANRVPGEIVHAARTGGAAMVQRWLESGGDPNWNLVHPNSSGIPRTYRLLMLATEDDRRGVMRILISHGADVNYNYDYDPGPWQALDVAFYNNNIEAAWLLLDNGADVSRLNSEVWARVLVNSRLVHIVLAAGLDFTAPCVNGRTPEDYVRAILFTLSEPDEDLEGILSILVGVRLAGSYKQYVLKDYKYLLRTRSLLARGRALIGPRTPEVVGRLFGGRADPAASRRATRRRKPPPQRPAGVPDPAFWLVMEYWRLGDWRRPRA